MIVCLVLYILSCVLCYFIIGVCQWEHVYERLYDCVSCPVYIVVRLMLFHYRCVSVRACVWKFVWLCVVLYILSYVLCYWIICVCQWEHVYESLYDCVSCPVYIVVHLMLFHYMCVSVTSCVWKFVWLCVVLYILLYVLCYFIIGVCKWEHVYESLYDCVSCPVYIDVRLVLFHYMCASVRACLW
jgi:cell division protein FtsX